MVWSLAAVRLFRPNRPIALVRVANKATKSAANLLRKKPTLLVAAVVRGHTTAARCTKLYQVELQ